jgi:SAM-dependent methyltransferase
MPESDEIWDLYWETRLQELEDLGKREAILAVSKLIRRLAEHPHQPVRLLELGCGEGQIIGPLLEAHAQVHSIHTSCGVDYSRRSIEKCRSAYPSLLFIEGNFTDPELMAGLGHFDIVLLVNALHEVFSACYSAEIGEVDVGEAKQQVKLALGIAVESLAPGGYLVLFDGLEPSGDVQKPVHIRFLHWQARHRFDTFAREYHPGSLTGIHDPFMWNYRCVTLPATSPNRSSWVSNCGRQNAWRATSTSMNPNFGRRLPVRIWQSLSCTPSR